MAGNRRDLGKPTVREARIERRRAKLNRQLAKAHNPRDRIAVAANYYRSALVIKPDAAVAELMVERLVQAADDLLTEGGDR